MTATAARAPAETNTRERILSAAIAQCEEVGLRRTTMEDVARRAGLARATLYRHFQSKDALVQAVIQAEAEKFFDVLDRALDDIVRGDERLVEGFALGLDYVRRHALLNKLLRAEPETLLPYLVGDSRLIGLATEALASRILDEQAGVKADDARAAAELVVRLGLSLALSPDSALGADDGDGARRLARRHLVPGLGIAPCT
jgi:AcrR family transcriptional regulator